MSVQPQTGQTLAQFDLCSTSYLTTTAISFLYFSLVSWLDDLIYRHPNRDLIVLHLEEEEELIRFVGEENIKLSVPPLSVLPLSSRERERESRYSSLSALLLAHTPRMRSCR
jgi:hypothetical protein